MLPALFPVGKAASATPPPAVPDGIRVYAIGDVHGMAGLLQQLLGMIAADTAARGPAETHIVMLGDLIDRGPDSRGVIKLLMARLDWADGLHLLRGNHEESLLAIVGGDSEALVPWLRYGGIETLESYGIAPPTSRQDPKRLLAEMERKIPPAHLAFMADMDDRIRIGDYLFVHAGIRPGVPLDRQTIEDLLWIREPFLRSRKDHGAVVVHGHTISEAVEVRPNRIGIDTGAYRSGRLTALALEGTDRWFLATGE